MQFAATLMGQAKPSQAKPSQAKPSQAKPSRRLSAGFRGLVAASAASTMVLTGCGGGGAGSSSATSTIAAPTIPVVPTLPEVQVITCWNNTVAATASACPVVNPAPTVALNGANLPVISFAPGATVVNGTLTATAGAISATYQAQPNGAVTFASGTLAYATLYTYSLVVNYSNGPSQTVAGTYTTGANPVVIAALGTKLFNPKMLPFEPGTTNNPRIGGPTWMESESADLIQSFDTGLIFTGLPNVAPKALVGKFFIEPVSGSICTTLTYKDTGLTVYTDPRTYGGCKTVQFDWVVGTSDGYIMHFPSISKCSKDYFDAVAGIFRVDEVVCP